MTSDASATGGPGDQDTGEEGMAGTDPEDAGKIGVGMEPDDAAEGEAMLQEAGDEGELQQR